ncbi:MAG: hypothetical protein IJL67_02175 [Oscillospiraceae bacterium]|nr:hypothetical protein [Oscillospiraceae bacterium]
MNLRNLIRRSTAGVSALCIAGTYLAAGSFDTVNALAATLYGDFNCDGVVNINDVIELSKYLKDPESVPATEQGLVNADVKSPNSALVVNYDDVQAIVESLAGKRTLWTNDIDTSSPAVHYGDADCDGDVDFDDVDAVYRYANDSEANPLTPQGIVNADVKSPNSALVVNYEDAQAIVENLAGLRALWTNDIDTSVPAIHYGDVDYDGDVDFDDVSTLLKYLGDGEANPLTPQGLVNADVKSPNSALVVNYEDAQAIVECLAGKRLLWTNDVDISSPAVRYGDVDYDGDMDFDDVKTLLKYLEDAEANPLTPQGLVNADVKSPNSALVVNYEDAQAMVECLAGKRLLWTNDVDISSPAVHYGDADCDGDVDFDDVDALNKYLKDSEANPLTPQGIVNSDVKSPNSALVVNYDDLQAIIENLAGVRGLWTNDVTPVTFNTENEDTEITGDFNCDGEANIVDAVLLNHYLQGTTEYKPSEQALKNANAFKPDSTELDLNDVAAIAEFVGEKVTLPAEELTIKDSEHLAGDFNCDNAVDLVDLAMLFKYLNKVSDYKPSEQGLKNANIYKKDTTDLDMDDVQALAEFFSEKTTEIPTETLVTTESEHLAGDFNCDNEVNVVDLAMLFKYLNKVSDYKPSEQGIKNANIYKKDSTDLDMDDLQALAEYFSEKTTEIPTENLVTTEAEHLAGDFNCDNAVNVVDLAMLFRYIYGVSDYQPSKQGIENANVYKKDSTGLDKEDLRALAEFFKEKNTLPTEKLAPSEFVPVHGDFNCDNTFDIRDVVMYYKHLEDLSDYVPSEHGKKNANITGSDKDLNYDDLLIMTNILAGRYKEETDLSKCSGDVNEDGKVDAEDIAYLRKVLLGSAEYKDSCDVNLDGSFSTRDFVILKALILQPAAEAETETEAEAETGTEAGTEIEPETVTETGTEPKTETGTETATEAETQPSTEPATEAGV